MKVFEAETSFGVNCDGLYEVHQQAITDDLLEELKSERMARTALAHPPTMNRVASVPTFVVELWNRQGYDFMNMTPREIVAKLEADDLHAFVTADHV